MTKLKYFLLLIAIALMTASCLKQPDLSLVPENQDSQNDTVKAGAEKKSNPVSIDAMINKNFDGSDFTIGQVLDDNSAYTRYYITYKSGELKISGIMNVPKGPRPFPLLILNHGYIDPDIYTNGRGLKREQDYLARRGYVVVHPDYRNHADSDKDPDTELWFRLGYTEDAINAINAIKAADLDFVDTKHVGMLGHSMGGGVTLNVLVIRPDLVDAAVLFAPVSADYRRNYEKWTRSRREVAEKIIELYGTPTSSPEFWNGISTHNYFDRITAPIQIHHGTADESVPIEWSGELTKWLAEANKPYDYFTYDGEPHEFINAWPLIMQRTVDFFDKSLKD